MKSFLTKLIDDTLKTPKGKWSRTSLTMFGSFWAGIIYLFYDLVKNANYHEDAFWCLMGMALGLKSIDIYDKHKRPKEDTANELP